MGVINAGFVLDHRAGPDRIPGTGRRPSDPRIPAPTASFFPKANLVGMEARLFRVEVEARRGEAGFLIETLVRWRGSQVGGGRAHRPSTRPHPPPIPATDPRRRFPTTPREPPGRDARDDPRGTTRNDPQRRKAAALGYPFEIIRLSENREIVMDTPTRPGFVISPIGMSSYFDKTLQSLRDRGSPNAASSSHRQMLFSAITWRFPPDVQAAGGDIPEKPLS